MRAATLPLPASCATRPFASRPQRHTQRRLGLIIARSHRVELVLENGTTEYLDVPEGQTIITAAKDKGLDLPCDCNLGGCKQLELSANQSACHGRADLMVEGWQIRCLVCAGCEHCNGLSVQLPGL